MYTYMHNRAGEPRNNRSDMFNENFLFLLSVHQVSDSESILQLNCVTRSRNARLWIDL